MYHLLIYILIIFSINQSIYCSYRYVGCYTQVFHDSHFISSFMEPTLCFRLCDTPIIYLQKTVCRCSGGGLMNYNRQNLTSCTIPCTKPVDRSIKAINTCGGPSAYSAYVQENFFTQHGHLFDYKIQFSSCELWRNSDVYETYEVRLDNTITRSSLNKLERCAAACLDQNSTTKSIAFNSNSNNKCLCMMQWKTNKIFERTHYLTILPNSSCDLYCNNTAEGSKSDLKYQCGSLTNPQIWAIYDLNNSCPMNFIYIKELKKCVYTYKNFWNSCTPPSISFIYDETLTWKTFLNIIDKLQLNNSVVTVDFDESVVIDRSWKCSSTTLISSSSDTWRSYFSNSRSTLYSWNSNTRYILEDGCLRESSYTSYSHRYSNRLCITDPINKYALTDNEDTNHTYISAINPTIKYCPINWFDLNGRCYRVSDERKTMEQARNSCISVSSSKIDSTVSDKPRIWLIDINGNVIGGNDLDDSPAGEIVEYVSEWQARIGFFLLDTDPDADNADTDTTTTLRNLYYDTSLIDTSDEINTDHASINEFQVSSVHENKNVSMKDNTCIVITRTISEEEEKPIITNSQMNDCSKSRHVLCETNTLIVQNFQYGCFQKPRILDLPALISNHLTYELCLSVCQELQTKLAILHINKCYCLNGASPDLLNITKDYQKFKQKTCGNACPGNSHDSCGNENTIAVFQILDSRRTYTYARTPAEPFPNYVYDSCIHLSSYNASITYQFKMHDKHEYHPRYCLALCTQYEQKYALINADKCLCTNQAIKSEQDNIAILHGQDCSQQCTGNYFYSCGNKDNSSIYSMYVLQPKCRHGFEVAENDQQCVYSHFSTKENSLQSAQIYCQSIGGILAKINDIIEIQDILPDSILHTRLMQQLLVFYKFKFVNDTRYYWIDRTNDKPDNNTISDRLLKQCSIMPEFIDRNCIAIQYVQNSDESSTSHERCLIESNECSTKSAMPVCVDQHIENIPTLISPITDDNSSQISINITIDHTCGDENNDYHFLDDYCYKISYHEVSWNDAKLECQRDNAIVFIPEKSVALQYVKMLYLRRRSYTSSGFAHVGVYYDNINRTVIQYNTNNNLGIVPDSNAVYDLCEKTFQERYIALMLSSSLTINEKNLLKKQQIGCAYIDLISNVVPTIRCDEIPCNRTAIVICQKLPTIKTNIIKAKQFIEEIILPINNTTNLPSTIVSMDDQSSTTASNDIQSELNSEDNIRSIGRDFAPIFSILVILFILGLLGFINTLYNRRNSSSRYSQRRTTNSVYSQLTSENEFDLN